MPNLVRGHVAENLPYRQAAGGCEGHLLSTSVLNGYRRGAERHPAQRVDTPPIKPVNNPQPD